MRFKIPSLVYLIIIALLAMISSPRITAEVIDDAADLMTQQVQEKGELDDMKREMRNLRSTMMEATQGMSNLKQKVTDRINAPLKEVHLVVKDFSWEVAPGVTTNGLTYNAQQPGPVIRLRESDDVRIFVHNQLKVPTSMCFHGMVLPHDVAGLPRKDAGLVAAGQTYTFQFVAPAPGTYWYHPQVVHGDQMAKGLYGAVVVEPAKVRHSYDRDFVLVIAETQGTATKPGGGSASRTYFTVNGKSAPAIPPLEVHNGERVRLRLINAGTVACPLYLTGHKFEIVSMNGADNMEPHVTRDTLTLQPGDRCDVEFTANNPGVWSLASLLPSQTNNDGKFPGGIAIVVRYPEAVPLR